ncbi:MAG: pentapeptide repeat-containing protein [Phycisphaerae bacterium]|nr:pentapeptide repeat-containing protein [Phycisphaerae bacterium]
MSQCLNLSRLACASLLCATLAGCDNLQLGTVTGADITPERNAFSEREFAEGSATAAELHHYVALHLEPGGTHDGDTGDEAGVDEIPYELKQSTTLSVGVPGNEDHGHWLEFCNEKGEPLALAKRNQASSSVTLDPGSYKVRVHHSGRAGAQGQTMFLRSMVAKSSSLLGQRRTYTPNRYEDDLDVFCDENGTTGFVNLEDDDYEAGPILFLTGDLSCANIVGMDYSRPERCCYEGLYWIDFGRDTKGVLFTNCKFDRTAFGGTVTDAQFIGCSLIHSTWVGTTLAGASVLQNCNLSQIFDTHAFSLPGCTVKSCNFTSASLDGTDFSTAIVTGCTFDSANLSKATISTNTALISPTSGNSFKNTKFAGVIAQSVDFTNTPLASLATDWSSADLTKAILTGQALSALNLTGTIFAGATLDNVVCTSNSTLAGNNFTGCSAENADFTGSNFTHATLDNASVVAANFSNCTLDNMSGHGASFAFSNFSNATFAAAQLGGAAGSNTQAATFTYAYMPNVRITDQADFRNVDFSHAHLYGPNANVQTAELTGANFTGAIISGMDFSGATLESCSFEDAQAVATKFVSARLNDAKFVGAYLMGADFTNAVATSAVFVDAAVSTAPCSNTSDCSKCATDECQFKDLNQAALCCYSFSERDGTVYAVSFGATQLPTDPSIVCPNGELGPCTGAKLTPRADGPYPPVPACVPTLLNWCPAPTQSK